MPNKLITLLLWSLLPMVAWGQATYPATDLVAVYTMTEDDGTVATDTLLSSTSALGAPVTFHFYANPTIPAGYKAISYSWKVYRTDTPTDFILNRIGDYADTEYTFTESGAFTAELTATFMDANGETIEVPGEGEEKTAITFTISESKLEFPNAFSPNGDDRNDVLKPKENGIKSIVSFHAAVFNRWGQKLYSWDDVYGGWDGMVGGKPVKDGVYFLVVSAKGGDGINYNIKKAINVLTTFNETAEGGE